MSEQLRQNLAIFGGTPVCSSTPPPRNAIGPAEKAMVDSVFTYYEERGEDMGYQGHFEQRYCTALSEFQGGGYADAVASGTAALFIALAALGLPKGCEVIVSPITDPGTLNAIILNQLVPRLADSKPNSYNMGVEQFLERISPNTRAVLVVHAAGQAADIDLIAKEARQRDIRVIEDCAQAHGARLQTQPVGCFGEIAAFSTMYRKAHVTGGCGGVVYTKDKDLYHLAQAHADRGKPCWEEGFVDNDPTGMLFPALNLHSNELSCAIGLASLARLPETIKQRLDFVVKLSERINQQASNCKPYGYSAGDSPFFYPILFDENAARCSKIEFALALRAEGVGLNPNYQYVVSDWPWIQSYLSDDFNCPNAKAIRDNSFNVYVNENYGNQQVNDVLEAIRKVEQYYCE